MEVAARQPGPRPAEFTFPFALARQARAALDEAAGRLRVVVADHEAAARHARVDFAGPVREEFDRRLGHLLGEVHTEIAALRAEASRLDDLLADAAKRRADAEQALSRWEAAMRALAVG